MDYERGPVPEGETFSAWEYANQRCYELCEQKKKKENEENRQESSSTGDKTNPGGVVSLREALNMEIIINQALIDLLVDKGVITHDELIKKIEEVRKQMPTR